MGILGIFTGLLIFLPIGGAQLQIVPAFWMVMMGILLDRALAERRAARVGGRRSPPVAHRRRAAGRASRPAAEPAIANAAAGTPEPARPPVGRAARKRRRKGRGGRG